MVAIVIIIAAVVFVYVQKDVEKKQDILAEMKNATYNFSAIINNSDMYILEFQWPGYQYYNFSEELNGWCSTLATLISNDGSEKIDVYLWYNTTTKETRVTRVPNIIE